MKFQCDRCKTRYSIGEEKIRGKVLKIRCKNCSAVITVREGQSSTGAEGKDAPAAAAKEPTSAKAGTSAGQDKAKAGKGGGQGQGQGQGKKDKTEPRAKAELTNGKKAAAQAAASPVLEDAFNRAMSRLPTPDPAKDLSQDLLEDEEDGGDASGDGSVDVEWYVSIDGEQEGPFSLAQAQKRVSKKQPAEEMFAWQEGFDDWLPVEKVAQLAGSLPGTAPARKPQRPSAPPMPGELAPPAATGGRGGKGGGAGLGAGLAAAEPSPVLSSTSQGKTGKSKVKEAPPAEEKPLSLAALAKEQADDGDEAPEPSGGDYDFDIGEASRVVKLPMLVPPPRSSDAAVAAPAAAARAGLPGMTGVQKVPRGTGGVPIIGGGIIGDDVNPSAAVLLPKKKNKHGLVFWVGGGAMVAVVGVLMVILLRTGDSEGADEDPSSPGSTWLKGYYDSTNNPSGYVPGGAQPPKGDGKTTDPSGKKNPPRNTGPRVASTNPGTVPPPGRNSDVTDLSSPGSSSAGLSDRDVNEVLEAQSRFSSGLKWCYERALKTNPDLKGASNRYDVQITITAVGGVRGVSVAGKDKTLKDCLQAKVNTWNFKPARADFTTQFPIVFN